MREEPLVEKEANHRARMITKKGYGQKPLSSKQVHAVPETV